MAAVDATEVVTKNIWAHGWNAAEYDGACATSRHCAHLAHIALAALFTRAGIDGAGTIALTRDDEGRYGLEGLEVEYSEQREDCRYIEGYLVPVEDDEGGGTDG